MEEVNEECMMEVYVDYVSCAQDENGAKATLHLSTEVGEVAEIDVEEQGVTMVELMSKYLSKYANGLYSAKDNQFIALSDAEGSLEGYEKYHLNYSPEYVEREFRHGDEIVSGYRFGARNPIYGKKIKCTWTEVNYQMEDNGSCFVTVGLQDSYGSFVDVYPIIVGGATPMECVLNAIKELAGCFYYCLEDGIWDSHTGIDDTIGLTCYDIDLEYDEDDILALAFRDNE